MQRRVVLAAWQKAARAVHARREAAFDADRAGLPAATAALLSGRQAEDLTYWDVERVVASLVDAGLAEKNFIGQYSNAYTAKWADAVRRYESGGVYLAEGAQRLVHQCTYELPALKKEVSRAEKELSAEEQKRQYEADKAKRQEDMVFLTQEESVENTVLEGLGILQPNEQSAAAAAALLDVGAKLQSAVQGEV